MIDALRVRSLAALAAVLVAGAAFLPWLSVAWFSRSGVCGDGLVTLACAVAGLVLLSKGRGGWLAQVLIAGLVVVIAASDLSAAEGFGGIGLYLTLVAGSAWAVVALTALVGRFDVSVDAR